MKISGLIFSMYLCSGANVEFAKPTYFPAEGLKWLLFFFHSQFQQSMLELQLELKLLVNFQGIESCFLGQNHPSLRMTVER